MEKLSKMDQPESEEKSFAEFVNKLSLLGTGNRPGAKSKFVDRQILNVNIFESNVDRCNPKIRVMVMSSPQSETVLEAAKEDDRVVKLAEESFQWVPIREEVLRSKF